MIGETIITKYPAISKIWFAFIKHIQLAEIYM